MIVKTWLEPIKPMLAEWVQPKDWRLLLSLEKSLSGIIQDKSKNNPLKVKKLLAYQGYSMVDIDSRLGGRGRSPLLQALIQFICGYYDLDYRDIAHVGHGRMVILYGSEQQRKVWLPKMASGSLVGILATEAGGGSRIQNIKTMAKSGAKDHFLCGEKVYISRIKEASSFVTFFKFENDETLSVALISLSRKGVKTEVWEPVGLGGWSWGKVVFDNVPFTNQDIIGARGQGLAIFKEHFVYHRPMVAMAALGITAAVLDEVMAHINRRVYNRDIAIPRDSTLENLAKHYVGINAGMLTSLCAIVQNIEHAPRASLWSRAGKAWSVEQAYDAVSDLALMMGASSIRREHFVAKALCDLRALLFADGAHDSLRRSAGQTLLESSLKSMLREE